MPRWYPDEEELVEGRAKVLLKAPRGPGSLFGFGRAEVEVYDDVGQTVAVRLKLPVIVLHGATPLLLGAGELTQYELAAPLGAWVPRLAADRVRPSEDLTQAQTADRVNAFAQQSANAAIEFFRQAAQLCEDPSDLVPILPLGTYVSVLFAGEAARLRRAAADMGLAPALGVPQLGAAIVSALREAGVPELTPGLPSPP